MYLYCLKQKKSPRCWNTKSSKMAINHWNDLTTLNQDHYIIPNNYFAKGGMIHMQYSNGYGSVIKLSKNRRKPFAARKTVGWSNEGKQLYKYIGYYHTQKEANIALADYNKNPYDLNNAKMTFCDVYEKWSAERFPQLNKNSISSYKATYRNHCSQLYDVCFIEIKTSHLQAVIDQCDRGYATKKTLKFFSVNSMAMP